MGEARLADCALILSLTGHEPLHFIDSEGRQTLQIGSFTLTAKYPALWSDPSVFRLGDAVSIRWGGTSAVIPVSHKRSSAFNEKFE